jgi:hypothetical protein
VTATSTEERFVPLHEDHSIQLVSFAIGLDSPLRREDLESIRLAHSEWSDDLPAIMDAPPGFEFDGTGLRPALAGVQFAYLRPDGSPAWLLRAFQNQITVECARYSRWARVWASAESHLAKAIRVIAASNSSLKAIGLTFQVIDEFRARNRNFALEHLIVRGSRFVVPHLFESGRVWHSHHAWFEHDREKFFLNAVNVDSRRIEFVNEVTEDPDDIHSVSITHMQQLRLRTPVLLQDLKALLAPEMSGLHAKNKALLDEILAAPIKTRISLGGT